MSASNSTGAWRASCGGVPSGMRLTCPKRASHLSPMTVRTSGRPDFSATREFVTKSAHLIPRVCGAGTTRAKLVVFSRRCRVFSKY